MIISIRQSETLRPIAAHPVPPRHLLVAEDGSAWPAVAEKWREQGHEIAVLPRDAGESEPAFARRLCTAIARAQLDGRPFDGAALLLRDAVDAFSEAVRARLLQQIAQTLLRTARPVTIHLVYPEPASVALRQSVERIHRAITREFRELPLLALHIGAPTRPPPRDALGVLATG
jgi:hypothetical protein